MIPGIIPPERETAPAWCLAFRGNDLLIQPESFPLPLPFISDLAPRGLPARNPLFLGRLDGHSCYAAELPSDAVSPEGMAFEGLRPIYGKYGEDLFRLAGRAVQIIDWDRTHRFCGRCGAPLRAAAAERAKECPRCGLLHFPRLAPAIIVLVARGPRMLLARSRRFPTVMYSTLAGFVEPGETLEEAVAREVQEETGITVKDIRYFSSQPWPFPHSLMVGFTATYESGEITPDQEEILHAAWFDADHLPPLPGEISIARRLIDWFLDKQRAAAGPPAVPGKSRF